jgi:hypothetical protein
MDLKALFAKYKTEGSQWQATMRIQTVRSKLIRQTIIEIRKLLEALPGKLSIGHNDFVHVVEDGMLHAEKICEVEYGEELFQELGAKLVIQFEEAAMGRRLKIEVQ